MQSTVSWLNSRRPLSGPGSGLRQASDREAAGPSGEGREAGALPDEEEQVPEIARSDPRVPPEDEDDHRKSGAQAAARQGPEGSLHQDEP